MSHRCEPGYEQSHVGGWSGLYGPPNLSADAIAKWKDILSKVAIDEQWLSLARKRGSISVIGEWDAAAHVKGQFDLYRRLARKFGYIR